MKTQPEAERCVHLLIVDHLIALLSDPTSIVYWRDDGTERTPLEVERMRRAFRGQVSRHRQRAGFAGIINEWPMTADAPFMALVARHPSFGKKRRA